MITLLSSISFYILLHIQSASLVSHLGPFDNNIIYTFKWTGPTEDDSFLREIPEEDRLVAVTSDQESFHIILPKLNDTDKESETTYSGLNGLELIVPLFFQSACAYRFESYWTYEICHGKHIKQYHEERDHKVTSSHEYYLGRWAITKTNELGRLMSQIEENVPSKKIDSVTIPYLQLNYTDGTLCDLNGKPRQADVLYMCYESGRHDFYSIKEISSCHYEVIIFTSLLCSNPKYKPVSIVENEIKLIPFDNVAKKPKQLLKMEAQKLKFKLDRISDLKHGEIVRIDIVPAQTNKEHKESTDLNRFKSANRPQPDINKFLSGEECIVGGTGWWKYIFCNGKYIDQFHIEKDNSRTSIRLGVFNIENQKKWSLSNSVFKEQNTVSHFYSEGAVCEKTKMPRETEVIFKCTNDAAISLYFSEPKDCKYILEIHSQMLCDPIFNVDEYGLFNLPPAGS